MDGGPPSPTRSSARPLRPRLLSGLAAGLVAVAAAVAVPAATDAGAASASPRCGAVGDPLTRTAAPPVEATPEAAPPSSGGLSQSVTVQVPAGRLYLEPVSLSVQVPASSHGVQVPEVLVADLRDEAPGWQLSLTVTSLRRGGVDVSGRERVTITPGEPRHVAGDPDVRAGRHARVGVGGCMVMATGVGWGSSFIGATIRLGPGPIPDGDTEVGIAFHLRPLETP